MINYMNIFKLNMRMKKDSTSCINLLIILFIGRIFEASTGQEAGIVSEILIKLSLTNPKPGLFLFENPSLLFI